MRVKNIDIDIDIADILGQNCQYRIDIGKGDIDPPLLLIVTAALVDGLKQSPIEQMRLEDVFNLYPFQQFQQFTADIAGTFEGSCCNLQVFN